MGTRTKVIVALMVVALVPGAAKAVVEPADLPRLESATLSLTWSDFKEILEKLEQPVLERPLPPPPFDWTMTSARYAAEMVGTGSVRIGATMEIEVFKSEGWTKIPVIGAAVAPEVAMLDGRETPLAVDEGWFVFVADSPGRHLLEMTFYVRCTSQDGVVSFEFPCVKTPLTHMTLTVPEPEAAVESPSAINIGVTRAKEAMTAELAFCTTDQLSVNWTLPAVLRQRAAEDAPAPELEQPRVTCTASTLATVTERHVACQSHLRYEVLRGGVDTFRLKLPKETNVLNVTGQGAAWTCLNGDGVQTVEVKVNHQIGDNYELVVNYEAPFEEETTMLAIPELSVLDVVRQTGFIGISAKSNVEIAPGPGLEGLTRIDTTELPSAVRAMSSNPLLLGYKYTDSAFLLAVEVRRLEDVPVRVASIDRAALVTMVTEEGVAVTRARYDVRNNVKQFLRVDVNEGVDIWAAEVGGQMVKPARDGASDTVLIPLFKSAETNRGLGAFPVELIYMEKVPEMPWIAGKLNLRAPMTDILANEVVWDVLTPEKQRVYRSTGDLKPVERLTAEAEGHMAITRRAARARTPEKAMRLREGVERFFVTDINNPAASAGGGDIRYKGEPLSEEAAGEVVLADADTEIAGVLPVRIDLPAEGVSHAFRRLVVPQGQPLGLTLYFYNGRLASGVWRAAVVLTLGLGLFAGALAGAALRGRHVAKRWSALAATGIGLVVGLRLGGAVPIRFALLGVALGLVAPVAVPWLRGRAAAGWGDTSDDVSYPEV